MLLSGGLLEFVRVMEVVPAVAVERPAAGEVFRFLIPSPEPAKVFARTMRLLAAVFIPFDFRRDAKDGCVCGFGAEWFSQHERSDIDANPVIDVRFPSDRLFVKWLPAHENVVRRLAGE